MGHTRRSVKIDGFLPDLLCPAFVEFHTLIFSKDFLPVNLAFFFFFLFQQFGGAGSMGKDNPCFVLVGFLALCRTLAYLAKQKQIDIT